MFFVKLVENYHILFDNYRNKAMFIFYNPTSTNNVKNPLFSVRGKEIYIYFHDKDFFIHRSKQIFLLVVSRFFVITQPAM